MLDSQPINLRAHARTAGILYLAIIALGLVGELVVRAAIIAPGDPGATAANILDLQGLFRLGFATDALMVLADVVLAALLYVLLSAVSKPLALIASATRLAQAAVLGLNLLHYYLAVIVLGGDGTAAFSPAQRDSLAALFIDAHAHGYDLGLLLFGVHCLVLGALLRRADFAPWFLGTLVQVTGAVYLTGSFTRFLFPDYLSFVAPIYVIAIVSELGLALWLLTRAFNRPRLRELEPQRLAL